LRRQRPFRSARRDDSGVLGGGISKVLRGVRSILSFVAKLSDEKRAELLVELDKTITEIKLLASKIRGIADRLGNITRVMTDDILTNADRSALGSYLRDLLPWEPSEFDLFQLKKDYARLRELIQKRNGLEKQLGITIR
jgi:hypothetical protein